MNEEIHEYNDRQTKVDTEICDLLAKTIDSELIEAVSKSGTPILFGF